MARRTKAEAERTRDSGRVQDRLAEAVRIYRASRGVGSAGAGRHALSEAA